MAKRTNGTLKNRFEIKYTEFRELGYVVIQADEKRPPEPDMLADLLSKSVTNWVKQRPEITVQSTLPILKDGQTVAIHLWYVDK